MAVTTLEWGWGGDGESLREEGTLVGNGTGKWHYWFMAWEESPSFIRTEMPTNFSN